MKKECKGHTSAIAAISAVIATVSAIIAVAFRAPIAIASQLSWLTRACLHVSPPCGCLGTGRTRAHSGVRLEDWGGKGGRRRCPISTPLKPW